MTCRFVWTLAMAALLTSAMLVGCVVERQPQAAAPDVQRTSSPGDEASPLSAPLHLAQQSLGHIVNGGLQLPMISRDGEWVAYLTPPEQPPDVPADLLSGEHLREVALVLAPVHDLNDRRAVLSEGACWPTFSHDSRRLFALRYDEAGQCQLVVHEIDIARTQRFELPASHGLMLAGAPTDDRIALAVYDEDPAKARLVVLDVRTGRELARAPVSDGGNESEDTWQLAPQWLDQRTLIYVEGSNAEPRVTLRRWRVGQTTSEAIAPLSIEPASPVGVVQAFASVPRPLGPRQQRLLYYESREDRLAVRPLDGTVSYALPPRTRAGCWRDDGLLVAARDDELLLVDPTHRVTRQLIEGRTLPRWAGRRPMSALLLTPAANPWQFNLVRLDASARPRD